LGPRSGVIAQEVEVIADQHQRARRPARVEPAGGVGHDQHPRAERDQHPRRERDVGGAWPS
jgi:hypothetical protein